MSFSFGTPSSAPANSSLAGGFSFGANKPATPGFGLAATSQPSTSLFGSTPATSAPAFGASLGAGAAAFGASATPAFGASSTANFGATSTAPAFGTSTAPAFGSTPAFGATSTAPAFGSTTAPAFGTSLGAGGLNFGAGSNVSATSTGLTLGAPAATSAGLGGFSGFGAPAQTTGTGLFGATTTTTGLFGAKLGSTTTTMAGGLTAAAAPSHGLGGAAPLGANTTSSDSKTEPPKQTKLPNEIVATVDSFKDFIKKQKSLSSEIMRVSVKPLYNVSREADATLRAVLSLGGEVSRARAHSRRMRTSAAHALASAEAVANVPGELEGGAPPAYVSELLDEIEQTLHAFRRQMDVADRQMQASPKLLTEQELTMGIRRMHESLVALAGRLQVVHSQVEDQKEQYLNLRKYILKDPSDVFDAPTSNSSLDHILREAEGSRKKPKTGRSASMLGSAVLSDPRVALGIPGNIQQLAGPSPFSYVNTTLSPFPTTETTGPSWQAPQPAPTLATTFITSFAQPADSGAGFTLQKPPGKRGKQ